MADKQKDLHTLIRLRKWDVDEKRRLMAGLLRQEEGLLNGLAALAAEIEAEKAFTAKPDVDGRRTFAAYLERCDKRREQVHQALAEVRRQIEMAREDLGEADRRLKTFEITQEVRDTAEDKEEGRVDQIELDEMGLN